MGVPSDPDALVFLSLGARVEGMRLLPHLWVQILCSRRYPGPPVLGLTPILTLDPSPAMLSMVHDYDLVTGGNHEGRKP